MWAIGSYKRSSDRSFLRRLRSRLVDVARPLPPGEGGARSEAMRSGEGSNRFTFPLSLTRPSATLPLLGEGTHIAMILTTKCVRQQPAPGRGYDLSPGRGTDRMHFGR